MSAAILSMAIVWAALGSSPAFARLSVHVNAPASVNAPGPITVSARTARGAVCSLAIRAGASSASQGALRAGSSGRVGWQWLIPLKAPTARWTMTVRCRSGSSHAGGRGHSTVNTSTNNPYGPLVQPSTTVAVAGTPAAKRGHGARAARNPPFANNPFPWGQCTWWADGQRPDIYRYAVAHGQPPGGWNGGVWLARAQAAGELTGRTPIPGALAVDLPYQHGAGGYGHVFYVVAVYGNGRMLISESNWTRELTPDTRVMSQSNANGFIYGPPGSRQPGPTPPGQPPPPPPPVVNIYHVYGVGANGLYRRTGDSTSAPTQGTLRNGSQIQIVCQADNPASPVNGSPIWDQIVGGLWVADYYVDTPNVGSYSAGIPHCSNPSPTPTPPPNPTPTPAAPAWSAPPGAQPRTYQVYGTGSDGLFQHTGPGSGYAHVGPVLPEGYTVHIICQIQTASQVNGSGMWDLLTGDPNTNNHFVADYYIDTPAVGTYSPGIAHCQSNG